MYCSKCGAAFPPISNFCPQCGSRALKEDPVHGWHVEDASVDVSDKDDAAGAEALGSVPTANPVPNPISADDLEAAEGQATDAQTIAIASRDSNSEGVSNSASKGLPDSNQQKYANSGSIVLGVFSLLSLILGVMQGLIPIFLIAGIAFGGLAVLCVYRWPLSMSIHAVVLVSSLLLAGVVGIALDRDTFGPSYRYLTQGNSEIRIDEKKGRTDRLINGAWAPIAFDHNAVPLPQDENSKVTLSNGVWRSDYPLGGEVCFDASNFSSYVVKTIAIAVTVKDKAGNEVQDLSDNLFDLGLSRGPAGTTLASSYGLLDTGESHQVCERKSRSLTDGETWSSTSAEAWGWKK